MREPLQRIITIGGSAGSLEAATGIVKSLDTNHPVSVCMVLHIGDLPAPSLQHKLSTRRFRAGYAEDGEPVTPGRLYIAPPDRHLMLQENKIRVTRGPRVNRSRPAIDLLFRSAAVAYGPRNAGVLLSGMLYDGTSGLQAIGASGGITVVQHPGEALYPDMPEHAIEHVDVDYIESPSEIAPLLNRFITDPLKKAGEISAEIRLENQFDLQNENGIPNMDQLGERVPVSCPECGGPLWELTREGPARYRCHTGHSMDAQSLLADQDEEVEKVLWIALRTMEEKVRVQEKLARTEPETRGKFKPVSIHDRIAETRAYAERLRKLLMERNKPQSS